MTKHGNNKKIWVPVIRYNRVCRYNRVRLYRLYAYGCYWLSTAEVV
jgi:hypothetical protein